jgi:hypothetical protein
MVKFNIKIRRLCLKNMKYLIFTIILMALFTSFAAAENNVPVNTVESIAIITDFKGGCSVKPAASVDWKSVSFGMPIYEGDEFKTSSGSYMEITFDDATLVRLDENANLKLAELKRDTHTGIAKTIFNLALGKILAVVDKLLNPSSSFEVHTKMAIAAVKGTRLAVNSADIGSRLGVFEGSVLFTGADGSNGVRVDKDGESSTGKDGKPSVPSALKEMLKDKDTMDAMLETIKKITKMKHDGTLLKFLEEKNKDNGGELHGDNNGLKDRLRRELRDTRRRSLGEMGYANNQAKQDAYNGKTAIDAHGNRVRFAEYIIRPVQYNTDGNPVKNEVDYLNLTSIDKRINSIRTAYYFANNLVEDIIPENYWNNFWDGTTYPNGPANYLMSKNTMITNGTDKIETDTSYQMMTGYDWGFSTAPQINDRINVKNSEQLSVNDRIEESRSFGFVNSSDPAYSYQMNKDYKYDQTWTDLTNPNTADKPVYTPYFEERANPSDLNDRSVFKHYNDGTILKVDYYFINNNGTQASAPVAQSDIAGLFNSTNMEAVISSNIFTKGSIEILSKYMWMHYANVLAKPAVPLIMDFNMDYWDLLNPRDNQDNRMQYHESVP